MVRSFPTAKFPSSLEAKLNSNSTGLGTTVFVGVILFVTSSLLVMETVAQRGMKNRRVCANRIKRLGLAVHQYHDAFKRMPAATTGTDGPDEMTSNQRRLSGFAALLPFIDQQPAWEALSNRRRDNRFPPMGPSPSVSPNEFPLWGLQMDALLCPSEPSRKVDYGLRSYLMCYGDGIHQSGRSIDPKLPRSELESAARIQRYSNRGIFVPGRQLGFRDVLDGTSNTILMSETVVDVSVATKRGSVARQVVGLIERPANLLKTIDRKANRYRKDVSLWSVSKGSRWAEGNFVVNALMTVMPPGGPSGTVKDEPWSGCMSASSHHAGGINVIMADGAIWFVSESIDTGDLNAPSVAKMHENGGAPSPYGVWGALGTRASKEIIPSEREAAFEAVR